MRKSVKQWNITIFHYRLITLSDLFIYWGHIKGGAAEILGLEVTDRPTENPEIRPVYSSGKWLIWWLINLINHINTHSKQNHQLNYSLTDSLTHSLTHSTSLFSEMAALWGSTMPTDSDPDSTMLITLVILGVALISAVAAVTVWLVKRRKASSGIKEDRISPILKWFCYPTYSDAKHEPQ